MGVSLSKKSPAEAGPWFKDNVDSTQAQVHTARRQSPEAAIHSTAHVSAAMARRSQAPVLILTAPYASAIRIAMVVVTAAA
jgi:hypothetical protein